ncbi:uncharacterized protein LOC128557050 isoform X1 [Mercenaria mercenaria]|uniref:uncharacterized protein LOC128557050 isoform X1 n=1 Tax=Mercenaria mercenaria TaxID=6596 RepID=UPI00234F21BC|nr:uncharacterized protein LOC128557050 isoform X1 [Mercenaria mercenaria]
MTFNARRLEIVLKEVNADLEHEGVLTERLTQDIWTKLMSNLMQGEYMMAIPIRQELQIHIRKKRPDKIYTFNQIIHRLDEILDRYIPPPDLTDRKREKKGKQKQVQIKEPVEHLPTVEKVPDAMHVVGQKSQWLHTSTRNMNVQIEREDEKTKSNREMAIQTSKTVLNEATTQIKGDTFIAASRKDESVGTDKEEKYEEDEISREQYFTMQANESVLRTTIDDQQMKIKILEESVTQLERKNMTLMGEIQSIGTEKGEKIDVYNKAEREIKFLRNELKIKERTLQLSLIERNELLDRLSAVTSTKMANGNSNTTELGEVLRPTQIADKYSKLFDSEWTDAFHLLTLEMKEEKTVIQWLLEILQDSYWFCVNTNESHTKLLLDSLLHPFRRTSETKAADPHVLDDCSRNLLTNLKRSAAKDVVPQVQVQFFQTMQKTKKIYYEDKTAKKLMSYIDKCVELSWFMVNQDPPCVS